MEEYEDEPLEDRKSEAIRANLREKFLRLLTQLSGKECTISMFESTKVTCTTKAYEPSLGKIFVENLKTPLPNSLRFAILRCNDVISIEYNL